MLSININRNSLEKTTASLAVTLMTLMIFVITLAAANAIFSWDLFPLAVEKSGVVFIVASFLIIFASVIINIMVNIGRIADKIDGKK